MRQVMTPVSRHSVPSFAQAIGRRAGPRQQSRRVPQVEGQIPQGTRALILTRDRKPSQ